MLPDDKTAAPECGPDLLGTGVGVRSGPCSLGDESSPIIALLQTYKLKVVETYAHRRVNLEAVAASSSASSEATDGPTGV
jgi:hypothetical protein